MNLLKPRRRAFKSRYHSTRHFRKAFHVSLQVERLEERIVLSGLTFADLGLRPPAEPLGEGQRAQYLGPGIHPDELQVVGAYNINAADTINADQLQAGGALGLSLDGLGLTVGVWDEGPARDTHQEFGTRVSIVDAGTLSDHATHVAGTIGAAGIDAAARGVADEVNLHSYDWTNDLAELNVAALGLDASNHSYGLLEGWAVVNEPGYGIVDVWMDDRSLFAVEDPSFGKYSSTTATLDHVLYDNPYLLSVWAAGNDRNDSFTGVGGNSYVTHLSVDPGNLGVGVWSGPGKYLVPNSGATSAPSGDGNGGTGYDTIPGHQTAKNTLVVGAIDDMTSDPYTDADVTMSAFSNWGLTDDGRVRPDVVAGGVNVYSAASSADNAYSTKSGTSMAAPSVTGTAVQLLEHYDDLFAASPLSSTTKGLLIHTAFDAGQSGSFVGPDAQTGWGVVDAAAAIDFLDDFATSATPTHWIEERAYSGTPMTWQVDSDGTQPLKLTLAWTDPAGAAQSSALDDSTPVLVNDLDLWIVDPGGTVHYPWTLDAANPGNPAIQNPAGNHVDNVEQVSIATPLAGTHTVYVGNTGLDFTQHFSLVACGGADITPPGVGSLHGQKFNDLDGDGNRDPGEPGLDGWTIEVFDNVNGTLVASQVTHSMDLNSDSIIDPMTEQGLYWFEDLPVGIYAINEVQQANWRQTSPYGGTLYATPFNTINKSLYQIDIDTGAHNTVGSTGLGHVLGLDVGPGGAPLYALRNAGHLYTLDPQNGTSTHLGGVGKTFLEGSMAVDTTGTTAYTLKREGTPKILNLYSIDLTTVPPGPATLIGQVPTTAVMLDGLVARGSLLYGITQYDNTLVSFDPNNLLGTYTDLGPLGVDFGTVGGLAYDPTKDVFYMVGTSSNLYSVDPYGAGATLIASMGLSWLGGAAFIPAPEGYIIELNENEVASNLDFGNYAFAGGIHGQKFHDLNGNGQWDAGEEGLNDWTIELIDPDNNTVIATTKTHSMDLNGDSVIDPVTEQGWFWFDNLSADSYAVQEVLQNDWYQSVPVGRYEMAVNLGDVIVDINFGNYQHGSIHGQKWHDINGDGVWDDNEPGIDGVGIQLTDNDGTVIAFQDTHSMDVNQDGVIDPQEHGWYWFEDLPPATYGVHELVPDGWAQSAPDQPYVIELNSGQVLEGIDFGNYQPASIHGQKWHDVDADKVWDPNEPGIDGVTIRLKDTSGNVIAVQTTHSMDLNGDGFIDPRERGWYWFDDLQPGKYVVSEVVPDNAQQTFPSISKHKKFAGSHVVTLTSGMVVQNRNFGNVYSVPPLGSIHGQKFWDRNGNRIQDNKEVGLDGVIIELIDASNGQLITTQVTHTMDVNQDGKIDLYSEVGLFWFDVPAGMYEVHEIVPAGWTQTTPQLPTSHAVTVAAGQSVTGLLFGNKKGVKYEESALSNLAVLATPLPPRPSSFDAVFAVPAETKLMPRDATVAPVADQRGRFAGRLAASPTVGDQIAFPAEAPNITASEQKSDDAIDPKALDELLADEFLVNGVF